MLCPEMCLMIFKITTSWILCGISPFSKSPDHTNHFIFPLPFVHMQSKPTAISSENPPWTPPLPYFPGFSTHQAFVTAVNYFSFLSPSLSCKREKPLKTGEIGPLHPCSFNIYMSHSIDIVVEYLLEMMLNLCMQWWIIPRERIIYF